MLKVGALWLCAYGCVANSGSASSAELVSVTSNMTVISITPQPVAATPAAFASVILLAGGNGVLALDAQGNVTQLAGNFLIRSPVRFMKLGLNVALLDAPGSLNGTRLSLNHARYVAMAIALVRSHWPQQRVWLVGTSNGTVSAFNLAARTSINAPPVSPPFADSPDGIVLTSPIVQTATETVYGTTPSVTSTKFKIPFLVVSHKNDPCGASDYLKAESFSSKINSKKKKFYGASGALPAAAQSPCDAFSYHGYHNIEDSVIKAIAQFIKTN